MNFKSKLKRVQRPDWTKNQFRASNKLWLDKNENSDKLLATETKKLLPLLNTKRHIIKVFSWNEFLVP